MPAAAPFYHQLCFPRQLVFLATWLRANGESVQPRGQTKPEDCCKKLRLNPRVAQWQELLAMTQVLPNITQPWPSFPTASHGRCCRTAHTSHRARSSPGDPTPSAPQPCSAAGISAWVCSHHTHLLDADTREFFCKQGVMQRGREITPVILFPPSVAFFCNSPTRSMGSCGLSNEIRAMG